MTNLILLTIILFPLGLTLLAYLATDGFDLSNNTDTTLELIMLNKSHYSAFNDAV